MGVIRLHKRLMMRAALILGCTAGTLLIAKILHEAGRLIVVGGTDPDKVAKIQESLDKQTDVWGIKVTAIEIKDIDLNETMVRAIAKQAEAERLRRAKVINAMGEQQAAEKLVEAGKILAQEPQAMQLRYFAALHDIAGERSSTVVFPLPMNLLDHLTGRSGAT